MRVIEKLSIDQEALSIDDMPTVSEPLFFNGESPDLAGGEVIEFINPETGVPSIERVRQAEILGTNGTYIFSPAACDDSLQALNVNSIPYERLEGEAIVIDLSGDVSCGVDEIREQLLAQNIQLDPRSVPEFIVFFRTGVMNQILNGEAPEEKPGLTLDMATYLAELNLAKAYCTDAQSFEVVGHKGFPATQTLLRPDSSTGEFAPVIYQSGDLRNLNPRDLIRIERGSVPQGQPSWPVEVLRGEA